MSQQLSPEMREVIGRALEHLVDRFGTEVQVSERIGISQPGINRAIRNRRGGPALQLALQKFLKMNERELINKFGAPQESSLRAFDASPPVNDVASSQKWMPETSVQLEAIWRTVRTMTRDDLVMVGTQFDTVNRLVRRKYDVNTPG